MFKKILLINPFGIGDVLFTTPVIRTLKEGFPGVSLGYLCNRRSAEALKNNPNLERLFVYERDEFEGIKNKSFLAWLKEIFLFWGKIKKEHYDMVIDFSLNSQYGFFSWYCGIKNRVGYDFKGRGKFLNNKIALTGYNQKHMVEYYGDLLKLIDLELKYKKPELFFSKEDQASVRDILNKEGIGAQDKIVVIAPGAGKSWGKDAHLKHWPQQNYSELADKVIENYAAKIIMVGDYSEKDIIKNVISGMHHTALDLCGRTSVGELAALLSAANLLITNDGGPLHMAVAVGARTVSIFGPVDDLVYGPYPLDDKHKVAKNTISCRPCYRDFRMFACNNEQKCIHGLSVEGVFNLVKELI